MNKKILLISYKYPPYPEVGGYRWAKFSKYFAEKGYKIHVVTVNWKNNIKQSWYDDILHENIIIHKIPSTYIHNYKYKKYKNNLTGRILNKIRNQILKVSYFRNYIDEAQYWGKNLIPYCKKIINKETIKTVIATGGPFMANYWASRLKEELKHVKLIHDLRDEWYDDDRFIKIKYKNISQEHEKFALNNCDHLVTVSKGLLDYYSKKIRNKNVKTHIIYNGFDPETINIKTGRNKKKNMEFGFLYAGSLSNKRDEVLNHFLRIMNDNHEEFNSLMIYIYSPDYKSVLKNNKLLVDKGILVLSNQINQIELFNKIRETFCTLHVMPETQKYIISIKLFEYASLGRPVLSLNYGGDTNELIIKHKLGCSVNIDDKENHNIIKTLKELYKLWLKDPLYSIKPVGIKKYSYKNLASEYIKIIEGN